MRVYAVVRFPVLQFNAVKKQFVAFGIVPQAGIHLSKMERQVPPKAVTRADLIA